MLKGSAWTLETTVTVPANVSITAESPSCVITPSTDANVFRVTGSGATVGSMTINGTGTTNAIGVRIETGCDDVTLSDLTVNDMGLDGVYVATDGAIGNAPANLTMTNVSVTGCGRTNIAVTWCNGGTFTDITSTDSGINGINFEHGPFADLTLDGFAVVNAARHGVNINVEDGRTGTGIAIANGTVADSGGVGAEGDDFSNDAGVRFRNTGAGCSITNLAVSNGHTTKAVFTHDLVVAVTETNVTYTP